MATKSNGIALSMPWWDGRADAMHQSYPQVAVDKQHIHGRNIANPIAMVWSAALMLDFLGEREAHDAIVRAIEQVLVDGPRTTELGEALAARV